MVQLLGFERDIFPLGLGRDDATGCFGGGGRGGATGGFGDAGQCGPTRGMLLAVKLSSLPVAVYFMMKAGKAFSLQ